VKPEKPCAKSWQAERLAQATNNQHAASFRDPALNENFPSSHFLEGNFSAKARNDDLGSRIGI